MAAVSGPTQESMGPLIPIPLALPPFPLTGRYPGDTHSTQRSTNTPGVGYRHVLERKREANSFLPALAASYACGTLCEVDVLSYFRRYAHLYTVGIDSNAACNLACGYCYLEAYNRESVPKYLGVQHFARAFSEVRSLGVDLIAIVGKEIFADDRGITLLKLLDVLSCGGEEFRFGLVTNGTLVHRFLDELPRSVSYVDVSLDGPARINDAVRGDGVFKRAGMNMRLLNDAGFNVWTSSVLHAESVGDGTLETFIKSVFNEFGCQNFYFSPVRNFTGSLGPFLLSYYEIARAQDMLQNIAEKMRGLGVVILDHPYEAVWRDYIWPLRAGRPSCFTELVTDRFGNILRKLSAHCYQKLDIFPHGPWGTCRIDARGEYLPDVESRALTAPPSCGSISTNTMADLHSRAITDSLYALMHDFLANMARADGFSETAPALVSLSAPESRLGPYPKRILPKEPQWTN